MDYILSHQSSEGWLGPDDSRDGNSYWSKYPMLLALRQVGSLRLINTLVQTLREWVV